MTESEISLRKALDFSISQNSTAVVATIESVRGCLFEIEQLDQLNRIYFERLSRIAKIVDPGSEFDANVSKPAPRSEMPASSPATAVFRGKPKTR